MTQLALDLDGRRMTVTSDGSADQVYQVRRMRPATAMYDDRFSILFDRGFAFLADRGGDLSPTGWRILMQAFRDLDFVDWRAFPVTALAGKLGVVAGVITKQLAKITAMGLVEKRVHRSIASANEYRLSVNLGWRGGAAAYHAERRRREASARTPVAVLPSDRQISAQQLAAVRALCPSADDTTARFLLDEMARLVGPAKVSA